MAGQSYRFGGFVLNPATHELWRGDEELSLPPKAFECLVYLVENRDRAVGRNELIEAVWAKGNVVDSVVGQAIFAIRRALGDDGEEPIYVKTVRSFGYHWVAAVETPEAPTATHATRGRYATRVWLLLGILLAALAGGAIYTLRSYKADGVTQARSQIGAGHIALLLPATVEPETHHGWMRFGLMEHIAERLRAAGQPMVPSETVIALTQGFSDEPGSEDLDGLSSTTGAVLVLGAHAERTNARWRVSVRSLIGEPSPVTAFGEADDVLEAARLAADRTALSLGLAPAPAPDAEPGLETLLRRAEAARLAQQMNVARELIESAPVDLRVHPEVLLEQARIDAYSRNLDAAQAAFEALLDEPASQQEPALRARALHGLAGVYFQRADYINAEALLEEAMPLVDDDKPTILGTIRRSLGLLAMNQGKFETARLHLAQAHRSLASTGDTLGLAILDNNLGGLEAGRERYAEALRHVRRAADAHALLHNVGGELNNRANAIEVLLILRDLKAASEIEPRVRELGTQTVNPELATHADLTRASLLAATGRNQAAAGLLTDVLRAIETREDLFHLRTRALLLRADLLARAGRVEHAAEIATELFERGPSHEDDALDDPLGRAGLIVLRSRLGKGDLIGGAEVVHAMAGEAQARSTTAPRIHAALARAELAAAQRRRQDAEAAFEEAWTLADVNRVPAHLLRVAERYVPWLLDAEPRTTRDSDRALLVADDLNRHTDQDFDAALLQLRVYHALGPPAAWRAALVRAQSLAGERPIPVGLLAPPQTE